MVCKTPKGYVNKQITHDGRESLSKWADRQIGVRKQTKTKTKRQKKAGKQLMKLINHS